jgi:hypothetical protein
MRRHHVLAGLTLLLLAGQVAAQSSITYVASTVHVNPTPPWIGVNSGHNADPGAIAWYTHMGVNGVRMFGGAGSLTTLEAFSTTGGCSGSHCRASVWGTDLAGAPVVDANSFWQAAAQLRSPAGHLPTQAGWAAWTNPPRIPEFQLNMNTTSSGISLSMAAGVAAYRAVGIEPLLVDWLTCTNFAFSTLDPNTPAYWQEHFELYKHQYIAAQWAFAAGVRKIEFWNEPDLNAPCITYRSWLEHYTLQSRAIQDAFADGNADVAAGRAPCPVAACPLQPLIYASAFAQSDPGSPTLQVRCAFTRSSCIAVLLPSLRSECQPGATHLDLCTARMTTTGKLLPDARPDLRQHRRRQRCHHLPCRVPTDVLWRPLCLPGRRHGREREPDVPSQRRSAQRKLPEHALVQRALLRENGVRAQFHGSELGCWHGCQPEGPVHLALLAVLHHRARGAHHRQLERRAHHRGCGL